MGTSDFVTLSKTRMTYAQELANALSMLVPTTILAWHYFVGNAAECFWHEHTTAFAAGTLLHLPFSFSYHLVCALDWVEDRVDCVFRRLDQTFIHVACAIFSFALSGEVLYFLGNCVLQAWYIAKLW